MKRSILTAVCGLMLLAPLPAEAAWAIALGKSGDPIVAREYGTTAEAKNHALADCNHIFGKCEIVATAMGGCAAFAIGGKTWGVAKANRRANARDLALEACVERRGVGCKVVHDFCGS